MKKLFLSVALMGSALAVGCSGSGSSGAVFKTCNSDADCAGEICNTVGHVCMTKCSQASDCPDTAKNCDTIAGATSDKVCQCQSDQLCGGGSAYCNNVDKLCETKCSDNSGCSDFNPARSCTSSQCLPGTADAGFDAGVPCGGACTATQTCDLTTNTCVASNACTSANTQDTCSAGSYCDSTLQCTPAVSCSNVSGGPTSNDNSPVIWGTAADGNTRQDSNCADTSGNPLTITEFRGYYYDPNGDVPTSSNYNNVKYVKPSGGTGLTYENVTITGNTFSFEICGYSSSLHAGVVLIDSAGNNSNIDCIQ